MKKSKKTKKLLGLASFLAGLGMSVNVNQLDVFDESIPDIVERELERTKSIILSNDEGGGQPTFTRSGEEFESDEIYPA